jgi:hypothetical protein
MARSVLLGARSVTFTGVVSIALLGRFLSLIIMRVENSGIFLGKGSSAGDRDATSACAFVRYS